jgi:hypothetical protein
MERDCRFFGGTSSGHTMRHMSASKKPNATSRHSNRASRVCGSTRRSLRYDTRTSCLFFFQETVAAPVFIVLFLEPACGDSARGMPRPPGAASGGAALASWLRPRGRHEPPRCGRVQNGRAPGGRAAHGAAGHGTRGERQLRVAAAADARSASEWESPAPAAHSVQWALSGLAGATLWRLRTPHGVGNLRFNLSDTLSRPMRYSLMLSALTPSPSPASSWH